MTNQLGGSGIPTLLTPKFQVYYNIKGEIIKVVKEIMKAGTVAHACNPSTLGGPVERIA